MQTAPSSPATPSYPGRRGSISRPLKKQFPSNNNPDRENGAGSSEFLNLQRDISDARTRVAQARLDQMWPGKTSVNVHVELDPKWEVRSEKVVPQEPLLKSEDTTKDSTDNPSADKDVGGSSSKIDQPPPTPAAGAPSADP